MTNGLKTILTITLVIFIQFFVKTQANPNQQFLQKVGVVDSLYSPILNESRKVYIQFPASYSPEKKQKYPVAFILDGEILLPTVHAVQNYYSGGFTPEMILVGISNAHNRTRDLTTSVIKEKYGMPFREESGAAANFSQFIATELIPFIENKYPVTNARTLIGHSYGGLFTIYTLLHHPALFLNYIAIDPSLDWDNQKLLAEAQEMLSNKDYKNKSLFMSLSGQLHMQNPLINIDNVMQDSSDYTLFSRSNITFSNMVKENNTNGLAFSWKFYPKDLHGTVPFPSIMDGLIFDFEWYQMENTDKFNSPETTRKELFNIINYRKQKLEDNFGYRVPPYPADLLNALGYMSLDMGQLDKAKMFFEFAIDFYPNTANVYDSMADYYERTNDYKKALKFVKKAFEKENNDVYKKRIEELKRKRKESLKQR